VKIFQLTPNVYKDGFVVSLEGNGILSLKFPKKERGYDINANFFPFLTKLIYTFVPEY